MKGRLRAFAGFMVTGLLAPAVFGVVAFEGGKPSDQGSGGQRPYARVFPANDRVEVLIPAHALTLAEPCEIPLRIHAPGLMSLKTWQEQPAASQVSVPDIADGSLQDRPIQHHPDGGSHITIIPMRLGRVELGLSGRFPDGGVVSNKLAFEVGPTRQRPDKLIVGGTAQNVEFVLMGTSGAWMRSALFPFAKYATLPVAVKIDPSFATYRIIASDRPAPVQIDGKTGTMTAVHTGQALVETSFGGRASLACIHVAEPAEPGGPGPFGACRQLLLPGAHLGPQE